jgi:molecular chaperone GrpE
LKKEITKDHAGDTAAESVENKQSADITAGGNPPAAEEADADRVRKELRDLNDKYLRLYAEFDNYRKRVGREKEELLKFGNEPLLYDLLPVVDSLELALKHGSCDSNTGVVEGVEITLKEFQRVLEKFGLKKIEAADRCFDPSVHHAMVQVEREDLDEKMVAEEMRAGYLYRDKVLRPSLVAVSVKPKKQTENLETVEKNALENSGIAIEQKTEEEQ